MIVSAKRRPSLWNVPSISGSRGAVKEGPSVLSSLYALGSPCRAQQGDRDSCLALQVAGWDWQRDLCATGYLYVSFVQPRLGLVMVSSFMSKMNLPAGRLGREVGQDHLLRLHPTRFQGSKAGPHCSGRVGASLLLSCLYSWSSFTDSPKEGERQRPLFLNIPGEGNSSGRLSAFTVSWVVQGQVELHMRH